MKVASNKIPFGIKDGVLVDVSAVESGLACGCVCPSCHRRLQANKGEVVSHYFSHDPSDEAKGCEGAAETAIHLMAKQLLVEAQRMFVPKLEVTVAMSDMNGTVHEEKALVESEGWKVFDRVESEIRFGGVRPDIIGYKGSEPLLIEVAVTHFTDRDKVRLIRNRSISAIEIDLSDVSNTVTTSELRKRVVESANKKAWRSNPAAIEIKRNLRSVLDEKIRRINDDIRNKRRQLTARRKDSPSARISRSVPLPSYLSNVQQKQHDPCWFVCEGCRHVFNVALADAPYARDFLPCPRCNYSVSTRGSAGSGF